MQAPYDAFAGEVVPKLRALGWKARAYVVLEGGAWLALVGGVLVGFQMNVDRAMRLTLDMRVALSLAIAATWLYVAWRKLLSPLGGAFSLEEIALLVERKFPVLQSRLASAAQFAAGSGGSAEYNSPQLVGKLIEEAIDRSAGLPMHQTLNHRSARKNALVILFVGAVFTGSVVLTPEAFGIWFYRNIALADVDWPKQTRLEVLGAEDGVIRAPRGDDLDIRARANGVVPSQVEIEFVFENGSSTTDNMVLVGERNFRITLRHVSEPFRFRLRGGDDVTEEYAVRLADRPAVTGATVRVTPPAYTRVEPYDAGSHPTMVEALLGSVLIYRIETNKPVTSVELFRGHERVVAGLQDETGWSTQIRPDKSHTYHFRMVDEVGLENRNPMRFSVRVVADREPIARLKLPGVSDMVTPLAQLPLQLEFSDRYGLASAELLCMISGTQERRRTISFDGFAPGSVEFETEFLLTGASLSLVPGQQLSLTARATDFDDVSGPNLGESQTHSLRVLSADDLLTELSRREQEYRGEFERIIDAQEQFRRDLLSFTSLFDGLAPQAQRRDVFAAHERRQRQLAARTLIVRQQFQQILTEIRINQLDTPLVQRRLNDHIIDPLRRLTVRAMPEAADQFRRLGEEQGLFGLAEIDTAQTGIITQMREILGYMLKWEGYQEAVTMLREISRLQGELRKETEAELQRQAEELFGD